MNFADKAYAELASLRGQLPLLQEAVVPGTPKRWFERDMSEAERQRRDQIAREDREAKYLNIAMGIRPLGEGKAPANLTVIDAQMDITVSVKELEEAVCDRLGLTPDVSTDTDGKITRIIGLLDRIALDDELSDHVLSEAKRMNRMARIALGDTEPIYKLKARCPICDALSLRVFPEREIVVCVNKACECDEEDCPCKWDKPVRHRWLPEFWENLNELIGKQVA